MATKKKAKVKKIVEKSKSVAISKTKRTITTKQYSAAIKNLEKARLAKVEYKRLREQEGISRESVYTAGEKIQRFISYAANYDIESNPAFTQLMDEIGDFRSASELAEMKSKDFYRYATAIRVFLANPLSDPNIYQRNLDRMLSATIKSSFTRRADEDINAYKRRRAEFIFEHEDVTKQAFKLYRMVEETNAGQIIKQFSPAAYGSENLISDITEFIETEFDGDYEGAAAYWREIVTDRLHKNFEYMRDFHGKEMPVGRYDWRRGYARFKADHEGI